MRLWRVLVGLVLGVLLGASVAHATNGWHSGLSCLSTGQLAASEKCAVMDYTVKNAGTTPVTAVCKSVAAVSAACTANPSAGSACTATFALLMPEATAPVTNTATTVNNVLGLQACELPGPSSGTTTNTGTVSMVVQPMTSGQVTDYMTLWMLFIGLCVTVLAAKSLYNHFRLDHA